MVKAIYSEESGKGFQRRAGNDDKKGIKKL
jgi:hypothetical protein|nr:MAG TPA: hypothetical protein [Caudoviricetes sp.]